MKAPSNGNAGRVGRLSRDDAAPELFDLTLERDFLGSCSVYPELVLASGVIEGDFYSSSNATIFRALLQLVADGEPTDVVTLRGLLHDRGVLGSVGGDEYVTSLTDGIPSRGVDALRLRRLARRRRVADCAQQIARGAGSDQLPRLLAQFESARAELEAVTANRSRVPTLAECIPSIALSGPRLPLGLPTLDAATRGGVPMGKLVALIGAPGASKTNLATWLADGWERAGCAVAFMAADESRESIITRLGQLDGFDRDALECGDDDGRRNAFARQTHPRALRVIDPFADRVPLEDAEQILAEMAGNRPRVLVIDSLQRVPCIAAAGLETKREQLEVIVEVIDGIVRRGTLVIAISEMSRAGYRTGRRDHDVSALAAGAESRAIEYAAHLLLGLKPVRGERGIVDVECAKNRLGPDKPDVRLTLDFGSLRFREIERPADEEFDREAQKNAQLRARIITAISKDTELRTVSQVVAAAGARKRDGASTLRDLIEEGAITRIDGTYRVVSKVPS